MTEDQQPVWVESDGVSNLPPSYAVGAYRVRPIRDTKSEWTWFAWFDGKKFGAASSMNIDAAKEYLKYKHDFGDDNGTDAWWDYQGLMAKQPVKVFDKSSVIGWKGDKQSDEDKEQSIFEAWLDRERPSGDADQIQSAWLDSDDYADLMDTRSERDMRRAAAIMATDEPGIAAHAERNKTAPEPEKVVVGGLTIDMHDLVEFLKAKQPKPEPNTTPRRILTMWNESADHRLGAFQQTGNFAD